MKNFFFCFLLLSTTSLVAQNCSTASMTLTTIDDSGCKPTDPPPYTTGSRGTVATTWTYVDRCTNLITKGVYYSGNSAVTGNGQCIYDSGWQYCRAANEAQVTLATSSSDFNRMYNRAYDNYWTGGDMTTHTCASTGIVRQNFQQCAGVKCPGGGGCCNTGLCFSGYQCYFGGPTASLPAPCTCQHVTPIIIDTTGHGFHLTSAENGVMFDFFGNGHPFKIAWTEADSGNGFLVLDRNRNGKIDDGSELFGNIPDLESNGFVRLAEFDLPENGGNGDGVIDARDAIYNDPRLSVWIDANHDGISQPEELHRPQDVGYYRQSLNYKESQKHDKNGNTFRFEAAVNPDINGDSPDGRKAYDVLLDSVQGTSTSKTAGKCPANNGDALTELLQ